VHICADRIGYSVSAVANGDDAGAAAPRGVARRERTAA